MAVDAKWTQFVADFCLAHGLIDNDRVSRLRGSDFYMLACRQFAAGARKNHVRYLLERGMKELNL